MAPAETMASERIDDEAARRELWISFASLVRFYVAAAQIGIEPARVLIQQPRESELELLSATRSVKLTFEPGAASGYWAMYRAAGAGDDALIADGAFRIDLDSLVEWTGMHGREEMDVVAEIVATMLLEETV